MGGCNGITVHNTYGTLEQRGKGRCVHILVSSRAMRSDCLYISAFFGEVLEEGLEGQKFYGTVQATQTNPHLLKYNLHFDSSRTCLKKNQQYMPNFQGDLSELNFLSSYHNYVCLQEFLHSTHVSAYLLFHYYINQTETKRSNMSDRL